jgi:hypothetical protein
MNDHADIPSTFDGELAVYAFDNANKKLTIGQSYSVKSANGEERIGALTTAIVMETESRAYGAIAFPDGTSELHFWDLTTEEMTAWRKHPDTFFGQLQQRHNKIETPLQLYDFFLAGYRATPKERLLEIMAPAADIEELRKLDQSKLASIYSERCAMAAWTQAQQKGDAGK